MTKTKRRKMKEMMLGGVAFSHLRKLQTWSEVCIKWHTMYPLTDTSPEKKERDIEIERYTLHASLLEAAWCFPESSYGRSVPSRECFAHIHISHHIYIYIYIYIYPYWIIDIQYVRCFCSKRRD